MEYLGTNKPVNQIQPLVSVCITTYNHAAFIAECLDSVLMQETDFPFEIIVGEDDSTDGTREICKAYAEKYPDKIRLFLRSENDKIYINERKTGRFNFIENLNAARGEYISICDGDDYWITVNKLKIQYDYLRKIKAQFCTTDYISLHQDIEKKNVVHTDALLNGKIIDSQLPLRQIHFTHTSTYFFHQSIVPKIVKHKMIYESYGVDEIILLTGADEGGIYHLSQTTSVYRVGVGITSNLKTTAQRCINYKGKYKAFDYYISHHKSFKKQLEYQKQSFALALISCSEFSIIKKINAMVYFFRVNDTNKLKKGLSYWYSMIFRNGNL